VLHYFSAYPFLRVFNLQEKLRKRFSPQVLPSASAIFYGRQKETDHSLSLFEQQEQVAIAVLGPGGIGKTSLALSLMHHESVVRKFEQRRYFIACDVIEKVDALNERFGVILGLNEKKPLHDLRRLLEELHQPILITLDNFETPWEDKDNRAAIEGFLSDLTSIPLISVIITLRGAERPAGVAWTRPFLPPVAPLDLEAAIEVFTSIADTATDDPHMIQLIHSVDLIPLAITLIAHQAQYTSCQELFEIWSEQKTRMVSSGAPYGMGRLSSLEVSIEVSLNSPRFKQEPDAMRLLQLLSILPDGAPDWFLRSLTASKLSLDTATVALLRTSLAMRDGVGNLQALSPVREYMSSHLPISQPDLQTGFDYLQTEHLLWRARWGTDESEEIHKRWRSQSGNIVAFIREGLSRPRDIQLATSTEMAYHLRIMLQGFVAYQPLDALPREAAKIAQADRSLEVIHAAITLELERLTDKRACHFVQLLRDRGDEELLAIGLYNAANNALFETRELSRVISFAQELLLIDPTKLSAQALAESMAPVASYLRTIGRVDMAFTMLRQAKTILEAKGIRGKFTAGINRGLASLDILRGSYFQSRRNLIDLKGEIDVSKISANTLHKLTTIASHQGRLDEAEKACRLAYDIYSLLGNLADWGATMLAELTTIYVSQGRLQDASKTAELYQRIGHAIDFPIRQLDCEIWKLCMDPTSRMNPTPEMIQSIGRGNLPTNGELFYRMERMWAAYRIFIISLIREHKSGYRLGLSMLFLRIGDYFRMSEQDMTTAGACYQTSLEIIDFIGTPIHQADALARIALCQEYDRELDKAATNFSKARARFSRVGMSYQLEIVDRKLASLGAPDIDKQSLLSFDAFPPPTLIGLSDFTRGE
jgi:tetratricopeptide (TPR) repeat protein